MIALLAATVLAATPPAPAPADPAPGAAAPAASGQPAAAPRTLSLDEAVGLAVSSHPDLRGARAGAQAASARADESRAALLPQIGVSGAWEWQDRSGAGLPASEGGLSSAGGTFSQLVWDFGRSTGAARAARESARSSSAGADETELDVVGAARAAYFEARARRGLVGVARQTVEDRQRQLDKVSTLVEVGSRPASDLARARSDLAQARLALVRAEAQHAVARAQLRQAIGGAPGEVDAGDDAMPPVEGEDASPDALLDVALAARPAARQAELDVLAQDATLASTRGALLPRVAVGATAGASGERLDGLQRTWTAGVSLTWSLFDGGANVARIREASATRTQLVARRDAVHQSLRVEVEQALASVAGGRAEVTASRDALAAAREDLTLAQARYDTGAGTLLDVSTAQANVATAAGQVVQADWDLSAARAQLAHALGRG